MSIVYKNLQTPKNSTSGISEKILFAPKAWFDTIACADIDSGTATLATATTIAEDHTFLAGKGFIEVQCAPFKNNLAGNTIGEPGSTSFDVTITAFAPGSYEELHATIATLMNQPLIALTKDGACAGDKYYQLGCECKSAWMSASFQTGEGKGGQKGYNITLNAEAEAIFMYTGEVTLMPVVP